MRKTNGRSRFNAVQVVDVKIERHMNHDVMEAQLVFLDTTRLPGMNTCGHLTLDSRLHHIGDKSREIAAKLIESLEEDGVTLLFPDTPTQDERAQEGLHVEPKGIVDEEKEAPQV